MTELMDYSKRQLNKNLGCIHNRLTVLIISVLIASTCCLPPHNLNSPQFDSHLLMARHPYLIETLQSCLHPPACQQLHRY
eukprot:c37675_g1_i1 orf=1-237(-)